MPSTAALDANYAVRLWKKNGGRYYAAIDSLALFGSGDTPDAATAELDRRFGELQAFGNETGVALDTFASGRTAEPKRWQSALATAAIVVVCVGLAMIPLSYALSTALERTVGNLHLQGGRQFWSGAEQSLLKMADPGNAPSPEEQAKILAALRTVVQRFQPFADEVRPILGCSRPQ
jgi:hypothetical protein